jgi:glycosyltransferase involved in cell wall biosynthesis
VLPEATPARTLSVIVPTRNRAPLWYHHWLSNSLRAQTEPPDELVIALDHCIDDTLTAIKDDFTQRPATFPVHVIDVDAPRPEPFPASGTPDNCLFHAATSEVILHVDDDIALPPGTIARLKHLFTDLPPAAVWFLMTFVDEFRVPLPNGQDWRLPLIEKYRPTKLPGGLTQPHPSSCAFTGAIFAAPLACIRAIGGHDLRFVGYHNQDTRLGSRLQRYCKSGSYISTDPGTVALHFGTTWHMQHLRDPKALRMAYGAPPIGPVIANGGPAFWTSSWFNSAYHVAAQLDRKPRPDTLE